MKIPNGINSPVQKIKERLSIEEVVSSYIKLDQVGSNLKAKCPFHNEKTPSFFVSPERGSYYCFGCGAKGDIFTFVEEFEGLDFKGALKLLADKAGVVIEKFNKEEESEKEKLYRVMEEATQFFSNNLSKNKEVLEYLKSRGLTDQSISDFKIGFAKDEWRGLYSHLKTKNFTDREIALAGLAKAPEDKTKAMYDRFRGRIVFPISDSSGRIIAFSGRIFKDDGKSAKYLNSPETPIFSKSSVLYGLDKAKESIRKNNFSILVEGQFDLVLSHQVGYKNTIATSGTALTDSTISKENVVSNLGLIRRLSSNIVLAFDADKAGFNASSRASKIALSLGMDVKIASLPEGIDPADLINKQGQDAWREAIRNSKHIIEFLLNKILSRKERDARYIGREIKETILPYVNAIDSSIEKSFFLKKISEMTQISESALKNDLDKIEKELKSEKDEIKDIEESSNKIFRKDYIEKRLLGIILWQKSLAKQKFNVDNVLQEFAQILKISPEEVLDPNARERRNVKLSGNEDLIFEAEVFYEEDTNLEKDVFELLDNLKEESLKEELLKKMQELRNFEDKKQIEESKRILLEISEINKKIQDIKSGRPNKNLN